MRYISTRGNSKPLNFTDAMLHGLADDGGLYLPETWHKFTETEWAACANLPYCELVLKIITPFIGDCIPEANLKQIIDRAYQNFRHQAIAPLKQIDSNLFVLELFHGPTLAFKDFALQLLGNLFSYVLEAQNKTLNIAGATSGDTGSAAIAAIAGKARLNIFMLHPKGKVSPVQEAQMTSILEDNVFNLAINGSFDDCQDIVKTLFSDNDFRSAVNLSAVNSINWARIMAQIVYYAYASLRLGAPAREIAVSVPSGNFGNIFAAWGLKQMGIPISRLIIGSNKNDILTRCVHNGLMEMRDVVPTVAPSMDIQISSNFERLLFELLGRDASLLTQIMQDFRRTGTLTLPEGARKDFQTLFAASALNDDEISEAIKFYYQKTGEIFDPHSVIGVDAATKHHGGLPTIIAATAHPAKFPDTILKAIGFCPDLPIHLRDLLTRPTKCSDIGNDAEQVKTFMRNHILI